ncbi:DUF418 domain-containing protein [Nesterenkonia populi]
MVAVNVGPRDGSSLMDFIYRLPHGRASLLFVLLGGVGFTLMTRRARNHQSSVPWEAILWRALLLLAVGLLLQEPEHEIRVILTTYAALFLAGLPLIRAGSRLLLALTVASVGLGPLVWILIQDHQEHGFKREPVTAAEPPWEILTDVLVTGPYPAVVWAAPFLFGMWLGRLDLAQPRISTRLILWGGLTAAAAHVASLTLIGVFGEPSSHNDWQRLVSDVAHSEMPLWILGGGGAAVFVLGVCLKVPGWSGPGARSLAALGRMALTAYAAHLLVLALVVRPGPETLLGGLTTTIALCTGLILFAILWFRVAHQGPLEALLRPPWDRSRSKR